MRSSQGLVGTATPLLWFGFQRTNITLCTGCVIGTDILSLNSPSGPLTVQIPCDPNFIGTFYAQGSDNLVPSGGCAVGPFNMTLTQVMQITIGS